MKLQEFSFGNFRSFKDINTLNLAAAKIKSKTKRIDSENVISGYNPEGISFLKSKAIYGANASGKSNVIKAFVTFIRIIKTSVKDEKVLYNLIDSFRLSTETENEATFFQIIFWDQNVKYRYGFELDNEVIKSEWLYGKPKERELCYFIRENSELIDIDKTNFSEADKLRTLLFDDESSENEIFRENSLFLSTLATFGFGKLSKQIVDSLGSILIISGLGHQGMVNYAGKALEIEKKKKYILDFLKYGDIGIEDITSIEISSEDLEEDLDNDLRQQLSKKAKRKLLISTRKKFDENLDQVDSESFLFALHESEGTKKLFELSPFISSVYYDN